MALILCFETQLHTFSPKMNYSVRAFLSPGNARVWSIKATMRPDQGPRKSTLVKAPTTWCVIAKAMKKWLKSGPRVDIIKRPDKIIEIFIIRDLPPIDYFKLVYQCQNVENILVWISKKIRWTLNIQHLLKVPLSTALGVGSAQCSSRKERPPFLPLLCQPAQSTPAPCALETWGPQSHPPTPTMSACPVLSPSLLLVP